MPNPEDLPKGWDAQGYADADEAIVSILDVMQTDDEVTVHAKGCPAGDECICEPRTWTCP
jgi:hypothetical protein